MFLESLAMKIINKLLTFISTRKLQFYKCEIFRKLTTKQHSTDDSRHVECQHSHSHTKQEQFQFCCLPYRQSLTIKFLLKI